MVWVALMVTDFELMIVVGAARLVEVLVTVLVGPVTDCVLVAVVVDALLASEVFVLLSFAAALEAVLTTFSAALDTAPLVDPPPHALRVIVTIASASAPETRRLGRADATESLNRWRGRDRPRSASREQFMLRGMLTALRLARNGVRRFARSVLAPPCKASIGRVLLRRLRRGGRRLEVDGDVLARIGLLCGDGVGQRSPIRWSQASGDRAWPEAVGEHDLDLGGDQRQLGTQVEP